MINNSSTLPSDPHQSTFSLWLGPLIIAGVLLLVFIPCSLQVRNYYRSQNGPTSEAIVTGLVSQSGHTKHMRYSYTVKSSQRATYSVTTALYHATGDSISILAVRQCDIAKERFELSTFDIIVALTAVLLFIALILLLVAAIRGKIGPQSVVNV